VKYFFASILLLCFASAKSQSLTKTDSVDIYISRLGWESFVVATTYIPQPVLREDAIRLVEIKDRAKVRKLINNIVINQRTVVIHQILTSLLDSGNYHFHMTYHYGKDSIINGFDYTYNGLQWTTDSLNKSSISQEEINKIDRYWRKRCYL
jgi:hypothetical protein